MDLIELTKKHAAEIIAHYETCRIDRDVLMAGYKTSLASRGASPEDLRKRSSIVIEKSIAFLNLISHQRGLLNNLRTKHSAEIKKVQSATQS